MRRSRSRGRVWFAGSVDLIPPDPDPERTGSGDGEEAGGGEDGGGGRLRRGRGLRAALAPAGLSEGGGAGGFRRGCAGEATSESAGDERRRSAATGADGEGGGDGRRGEVRPAGGARDLAAAGIGPGGPDLGASGPAAWGRWHGQVAAPDSSDAEARTLSDVGGFVWRR